MRRQVLIAVSVLCAVIIVVGSSVVYWRKTMVWGPVDVADYSYHIKAPGDGREPMITLLQNFATSERMTFQMGPLDPDYLNYTIELRGRGIKVFSANDSGRPQFVLSIGRDEKSARSTVVAAGINDALMAQVNKLPAVQVVIDRAPKHQ